MTPKTPAEASLYGILDLGYVPAAHVESMTIALCEGGVDLLQLRAKKAAKSEVEQLARRMQLVMRDFDVSLIINDHADVAAQIACEGVHVGQDDDAVVKAREVTGGACWVGKSTHSLAQAVAARMASGQGVAGAPAPGAGEPPASGPKLVVP